MTDFGFFKTYEFADENFEFDENGREFLQKDRKHCEKRRNCFYEQFLLFPQCIEKSCNADM